MKDSSSPEWLAHLELKFVLCAHHIELLHAMGHCRRVAIPKYPPTSISSNGAKDTLLILQELINQISGKVLDGLAKIKAPFQRDVRGELRYHQLNLVMNYLSVLYDHDDRNVLVTTSVEFSYSLQLKLLSNVKAQ
eukprot:Gb_39923 [translate_table: standard]